MRFLVLFAAVALYACQPSGTASEPSGQFGPYHEHNKRLELANGDTFTVYRVKRWTFTDGTGPALQLEYASHIPVSDTAGVLRAAERIWPSFVPYVEAQGLNRAIVTATNLEVVGHTGAWIARTRHFGLVASRDGRGEWHFEHHPEALRPADTTAQSGIIEADGRPLSVAPAPAIQADVRDSITDAPAAFPYGVRRRGGQETAFSRSRRVRAAEF